MLRVLIISIVIISMQACTPSTPKKELSDTDKVYAVACEYLSQKTKLKPTGNTEDVCVFVGADSTVYSLKKKAVFTGDLDGDSIPDAIASFQFVDTKNLLHNYHLLVLNQSGKFTVVHEFEKDMMVVKIHHGEVLAEKSLITSDAPNYGCKVCKEPIRLVKDRNILKVIP